ncbi:MAG: FAD:protein FMN transferase [Spirochaetales bacterium]|nr:FAD:protein FMN transferase [Spirochaetales bacterium]
MHQRKHLHIVCLFIVLILLQSEIACNNSTALYKETFPAMSTYVTVGIYTDVLPDWQTIKQKASTEALLFDHRLPESPLFSLNNEGSATLPPQLTAIVQQALDLAENSGGAFDPTILPLLNLWEFETGGRVPIYKEIRKVLPLINYKRVIIQKNNQISIAPQMGLDLGGIAKGAVVDFMAHYLSGQGYTNYMIDAGGDLLLSGAKPDGNPWKIAVRHPRYASQEENDHDRRSSKAFLCIIEIDSSQTNKAIVTSGDYERFFIQNGKRYHHIIDPHTGYPAAELVSVTVIADNCTIADGLATAAFVLGFKKGLSFLEQRQGVEALLIRETNHMLEAAQTSGFPLSPEDLML